MTQVGAPRVKPAYRGTQAILYIDRSVKHLVTSAPRGQCSAGARVVGPAGTLAELRRRAENALIPQAIHLGLRRPFSDSVNLAGQSHPPLRALAHLRTQVRARQRAQVLERPAWIAGTAQRRAPLPFR